MKEKLSYAYFPKHIDIQKAEYSVSAAWLQFAFIIFNSHGFVDVRM